MLNVHEVLKVTNGELLQGRIEAGIKGFSIDSRTLKAGDLFIAIKGDKFDGHDFMQEAIRKKAAAILCHRVRPMGSAYSRIPVIKVKDTLMALGKIAGYQRSRFDIPVIAVTGSNGKTTAKDMVAWVLSEKFNVLKNLGTKNNAIGLPMTLLELKQKHAACVLEICTNHFGEVGYLAKIANPNIGVITNIGPAHLEFFGDLEGVYKEKSGLLKGLIHPAIGLVNSDDRFLKRSKQICKDKLIFSFGIKNKAEFCASAIRLRQEKLEFTVNKKHKFILDTRAGHNVYNALAAVAIARLFGMDYRIIAKRLGNFIFPEGRLKFVRSNKINFIDDTYNSNPLSLDSALDTLKNMRVKGKKIFIMGDMLELGNSAVELHRQAADKIIRACDCFIAVGRLAGLAAAAVKEKRADKDGVFVCDSAIEARNILLNKIMPGEADVVLVKGSRRLALEEVLK